MPGPSNLASLPVSGRERWFVALVLLVVLALNLHLAAIVGETQDEGTHQTYGRSCLAGEPGKSRSNFNNCSPVSAMNALPSWIGDRLPPGQARIRFGSLRAARFATTAAAVALIALLWRWTRSLYGPVAAGVAIALAMLEPNLLAHSHLVTTDIWSALGIFAACWSAWRLALRPSIARAVVHGLLLGFALVAKAIAIFLPLVLLTILALRRLSADRTPNAPPVPFARLALAVSLSALMSVHIGYGFSRAFSSLEEFRPRSLALAKLGKVPGIRAVPIPLPDAWVQGLDLSIHAEREKPTHGQVYLLGRLRDRGFPGYYFVAALFKVPLPLLLLLGLVAIRAARLRPTGSASDVLFLALPLGFYAVYLNFFYNSQIGIRHALPLVPFLLVFAGGLFRNGWPHARIARFALAGLGVWLVGSFGIAWPHYIAYFNELVPDRRFAWRILADSNLDWGQSRPELASWLHANPGASSHPQRPVAGLVVVRANGLAGTLCGDCYSWLRPLDPVDELGGGSYLVFDVPESFVASR